MILTIMSQVTLWLLRFTYKIVKEKLTVSDSKALFHEEFPFVIPSLYKRIVDEMLVELNLLNNQTEFIQEKYFCVGLRETFNELTKGYEPKMNIEKLFKALCKSTNFQAEEIIKSSQNTLKDYKNKSLKEISNLIIENKPNNHYYSRIFSLGIYKIISSAKDFIDEEDINKITIIKEITEVLKIPLSRTEKDISLYKSNIKKLNQAKSLMEETIRSEREKRNKK